MYKCTNVQNSGLPKLLRWSHALRSDQLIFILSYASLLNIMVFKTLNTFLALWVMISEPAIVKMSKSADIWLLCSIEF